MRCDRKIIRRKMQAENTKKLSSISIFDLIINFATPNLVIVEPLRMPPEDEVSN